MKTKFYKPSKLEKAIAAEAEAKKVLVPTEFFQLGIYGSSFRAWNDPDVNDPVRDDRVDRLAEKFTAILVGGKWDPCTEHDVFAPKRKEVKFRSLSLPDNAKSGCIAAVTPLDVVNKTADELFMYTYNPVTSGVDLFVVPKEVYLPGGFSVYYSTVKGEYTEKSAKYRVDPEKYKPEFVYTIRLAEIAESNRKITVPGLSDDEIQTFARDLIYAASRLRLA